MAAESNPGFHARHSASLQSGAMNTTSDVGGYFGSSGGGMLFGGNWSGGLVEVGGGVSSSSSGLKHDTGFALDWSPEEHNKLQEGLQRYADEPNILKYVKIAASMPDKTVRDVALRCRWIARKRRKADEFNPVKKANNRKDKFVESSANLNMPSVLSQNMALYPLMMHHMDRSASLAFEVASGTTRHLLEQNAQAFSKISTNLSLFKDNIDLFCRTRNNINAVLNEMREMPGIMSQMPPLPVSLNDDLANSLLPNATLPIMFCSSTGIQLKQEPRC